jgi:hypothetical protein
MHVRWVLITVMCVTSCGGSDAQEPAEPAPVADAGSGGAIGSGGAAGGTSDAAAGSSPGALDAPAEAPTTSDAPAPGACGAIATFADGLAPTREIFVAPGGNDGTGDGSAAAPYATIQRAASQAQPGDAVRVRSGTYAGGSFIANLRGTAQAPIWLGGTGAEALPVIQGSDEGMHLVGPRYLVVENLEVSGQTGNGLNVDDGASYADPDAARYVVLRNIRIHDIGTGGNNDCLKLSGLNDYFILDSTITTCSGQGIDHVGCHRGVLARNHLSGFTTSQGPAIQAKGGSEDILVTRNLIEDPGDRGVNMGGSTGYEFFRPPLQTGQPNFEAKNIRVVANVVRGGNSAVAYVGCPDCVVANNTIVDPARWIARILQETVSDATYEFLPAQNGQFVNNVVCYARATLSAYEDINVGANTQPDTFVFENNLWYAHDDVARSKPTLPAVEQNGVYGQDPGFSGASSPPYHIASSSPAVGKGKMLPAVTGDYDGVCYASPPSIGAFEGKR